MAYVMNGWGRPYPDRASHTNSGLSYNASVEAVASSAAAGTLAGFNSAYSVGGGCTWWASGRSSAGGRNWAGGGHASNWFNTFGNAYGIASSDIHSYSDIHAGDVLCFDDGGYGHLAFVEAVNGNTLWVSEGASGSNNYNVVLMSSQSVSQLISTKRHWFWGETFEGLLLGEGTAPSPPVPPQPDPKPWDDWYWDDDGTWETIEVQIITVAISYDDIYECGTGTFGDQSGTQDDPKAPDHISSSSSRLNQRWEPFNMYTYERRLTYLEDKSPTWSNWEEKYQGSDGFPLGNQPNPQFGNGWESDWDDERE